MMLCKLSLKNISKSIKDYTIYFFTLILGVSIFYVFNSMDSQTAMLEVSSSTHEVIGLMINILSGVSVFVSIILGCLIIYASRFLIKRRNKEFGIYLTLGMSKRKISFILFLETIFIGLISLCVGLCLGVFLSQFMSIIVANMFDADMTKFKFVFSNSACIKTLIYFSIMYLLVMIFNTVNISKVKLISLLSYNKREEKIKLKNPYVCTILFIISVILLSVAYYLVTDGISKLNTPQEILIPIALGALSTFLIFFSLSGLLLRIFMSLKKIYYRGLNSFTLRQLSSKISTTVLSMTVICLMLFITICVLSASLSMKNSMTANINKLAPVDVEFSKSRNIAYEDTGNNELTIDSQISIEKSLKNIGIDLNDYFKDSVSINAYRREDFTMADTFGSKSRYIEKVYGLNTKAQETYIKISDYNKLAKYYNKETYSLKNNEYMIIADYGTIVKIRNISLKAKTKLNINGYTLKPKYNECKEGFIDIGANYSNSGIVIVPDNVVNEADLYREILVANYKSNKIEEKKLLDEELVSTINSSNNTYTIINTKIDVINASVGIGVIVTFIGLYLGIIFLISSAAILALKQLSESTDNKERYNMLRKLGADERLINKALFRQIGIFFMFPLILAIIHSIFGIRFSILILETFGKEKLLSSVLTTMLFLIFIYGGYFILTYLSSKAIIKER